MTTRLSTLIRLRAIQNKTRALFADMSDIHYRLQYHHDLSPAGWHLGHGMFIENYWLHEVVCGDNQLTNDPSLYNPQNCPKPERGPRLSPLHKLLEEISAQQDENDLFLLEKTPPVSEHPLFKDEYLENFIIQHYAQHYETINMVLSQIALKQDKGRYQPEKILRACKIKKDLQHIKQGSYSVGGEKPYAYDNELPVMKASINSCYISRKPVTNGEFLSFMCEGAYQQAELWCSEGWEWLQKNKITHPEHWKQNTDGHWYGISVDGACDLLQDEPVHGLSHYEASAFAKWSGARLAHEHEWETAVRLGELQNTAKVWEWCHNTLFPYPEFEPFPYKEYSSSWFDNQHYVLRGASQYTRNEIKRASFRNFYQAHQRHIFAGLRLVFE